jgi:hypothetical protein
LETQGKFGASLTPDTELAMRRDDHYDSPFKISPMTPALAALLCAKTADCMLATI